jgi:hypothetical protein
MRKKTAHCPGSIIGNLSPQETPACMRFAQRAGFAPGHVRTDAAGGFGLFAMIGAWRWAWRYNFPAS